MRIKNRLVYGVGINDYSGSVRIDGKIIKSYKTWCDMLFRCYSHKSHEKNPTYIACGVHDDWIYFCNFKNWFDINYVKDFCLDKDILVKGNKIYSPETCCFVPQEINTLLVKSNGSRGQHPLGVSYHSQLNKFQVRMRISNIGKNLGLFNTANEAFQAYKTAKEAHIKEVATEYYTKGKINERVYQALMKYEVEITD